MIPSAPIIIVGAGPAGLMAAIAAASGPRPVLLFERMPRPGLKLLASGGGRCNITNTLEPADFVAALGRNGRFAGPALDSLSPKALRSVLKTLGVPTHTPDGFHVFPTAEKSCVVLEALLKRCDQMGVQRKLGVRVSSLLHESGSVTGVQTATGEVFHAAAVILATGGASHPQLSGGDYGYELARQAGHTVTPLCGVLVRLVIREQWPAGCAGVTLDFAEVWLAQRPATKLKGRVLFTHDGLSGPAILDLSREVVPLLAEKGQVPICVRWAPAPLGGWRAHVAEWRQNRGRKSVRALLDERMPKSLACALVAQAAIAQDKTAAQLSKTEQERLIQLLEGTPLTVIGSGGMTDAMVTRGGVSLKEVNPKSLESRLVQKLFFAGEILDLDGPCGGFNLQWAFSSGWLAGKSVATV